MHQILNNTRQNVINHAANANHAVVCGHSAESIVAAAKRLLARKRLSTLGMYKPVGLRSGMMQIPEFPGQCQSASSGRQPVRRTSPGIGTRPSTAGETPATIWAALVISRALSS